MSMRPIKAEISGTVWKVLVKRGQSIHRDDPLIILEAMKMEIPVSSPCDGTVAEIRVGEDDQVSEGELVAVVATT